MRSRSVLALLISAFGLAGFASAQTAPPPPMGFAADPTMDRFAPPPVVRVTNPPAVIDDGGLFPQAAPPKLWTGGADIGLNGAEGNSKLFNIRAGIRGQRKTDTNLFTSDFLYTFGSQANRTTQNQALLNARDEILFPGSKWSIFGSTNIEYDELKAYRFRIGLYGGVGYQMIDTATDNWRLRAGAGASRQFTGSSNSMLPEEWIPELLFGTDYTHNFNDTNSFVFNFDYYPRVNDFGQYRIRARAAYQVVLDKTNGVTLRLGVQDRFDSNPGTARQNDLTYFAALGFSF